MNKPICKDQCHMSSNCPAGRKCFIRNYLALGGKEKYLKFLQDTIDEFNILHIHEVPKVNTLIPILGKNINYSFSLPNKTKVKILDDDSVYLGMILVFEFITFCFAAGMDFLMIFSYIEDCTEPELILYKRR